MFKPPGRNRKIHIRLPLPVVVVCERHPTLGVIYGPQLLKIFYVFAYEYPTTRHTINNVPGQR